MDQNSILSAFKMCLSGDNQLIKQGQQFLEENMLTPNFASSLMLIIDDTKQQMNDRQYAITTLKNLVEKKWRVSQKLPTLPEQEKESIRNNILDAMIRVSSERKLYKTYDKIIYIIATIDYPQNWGNIIESLITKLTSSDDYNNLFGSLTTLRSICQVFEYQMGEEDREPLEQIVEKVFPTLLQLANMINNNYSEQTATLMQIVLKTFYLCVNLDIPRYLAQPEILKSWIDTLKTFFVKQVPEQYRQKPQKESQIIEQGKVSFWKNKKIIGKILMRFAQKHSNANLENKNTKGLAQFYVQNYGTAFLDMFIETLYSSQQQFVSLPTIHFSMRYIQMSLRVQELVQYLTPKLSDIAKQVCIPITSLTQKDQELFINDPIEFMRKEEDFSQTMYNPKNAALDLIEVIVKQNNGQHLQDIMKYFFEVLSTNTINGQPLTPQQKDGIFWTFGELYPDLIKHDVLKSEIEGILEKFVLPLYQNPEPYLRSRVCWLYGMYGSIAFKNQQVVENVTRIMCTSILDQNLIIKTKAAVAINRFLSQKVSKEIIRSEVKKLVEIYLKLMEEVDSEEIVSALEGIINNFGNEVRDFSIGLIQQLIEAFYRYDEKEGDEDDMYGEGEFAAAGCLNAINKIIQNNLSKEVYQQIENLIYPVMLYTLTEESDYLEEGLDMIGIFIQKSQSLSERLYFLFVATTYMVVGIPEDIDLTQYTNLTEQQRDVMQSVKEGWGVEYTYKALPIFKNTIQKNPQVFLTTKDFFGKSFIDLMFATVDNVITECLKSEDDTDMTNILHYYISFIENNLQNPDARPIVENIVKKTLEYLNKHNQYNHFSFNCYIIICTAMIYDVKLVLEILEKIQVTGQFFEHMFQAVLAKKKSKNNNDLECQKIYMGLTKLLQLHQNEMPQSVIAILKSLMQVFVFLTDMILQLREVDEDEDDDDDDEEGEDDDYTFFEKVEYSDKYDTPLDEIDELIQFSDQLNKLQGENEPLFKELIGYLTQEQQTKLDSSIAEAKKQYQEYLQLNQKQN